MQAVVSSVSGALLRTSAALGQPGAATFVLFLGGLVVAVAAMLLWLELVVRTAAIYVAVLFLPSRAVDFIQVETERPGGEWAATEAVRSER